MSEHKPSKTEMPETKLRRGAEQHGRPEPPHATAPSLGRILRILKRIGSRKTRFVLQFAALSISRQNTPYIARTMTRWAV